MDLNTATPVEIDTALADLYYEATKIGAKITESETDLLYAADAKRLYGRGARWNMTAADAEAKVRANLADGTTPSYERRQAERILADLDAARAELDANHAEQRRIGAEFRRRGGWTRAFLVTDGHVHSSVNCSTCNNGNEPTQFTWLTEFSDKTEAEVIDAAASRACTVCYPDAPVETAGPSRLMTPEERTRAEQRDDAAKAKAERLAKKIEKGLTADGSEFVVSYVEHNGLGWERDPQTGARVHVRRDRERTERFKTERAATQWVVQYAVWDGSLTDGDKAPAFAAVIEAVAAKHGKTVDEVTADIEKKIAAKIKRDGR